MTLSTLAILIGVIFSIPQVYALANPKAFADKARQFPRSTLPGYILMAVGTIWFLINLNNEAISDFAAYKKIMLFGFGALGLLACVYVRDFIAVRGFAIVLLLAAWFTINHAKWADTPWRLVLVVWAYIWIIAGMWLTVSPYKMRDYLAWLTATESRIRTSSALRLAFGVFVVVLGLTAFRT